MKHNTRTKTMSWLLALVMLLSLVPCLILTAFAGEASPYAGLKNTTTAITFDSKQWYLIDYDDSTVTLLSKECVGASVFNPEEAGNSYSGSTLETYVNNWYSENITADVKTAVADNKAFILESLNGINPDVLKCNPVGGTYGNLWWLCSPSYKNERAQCVDGDGGYLDDRPVKWEYGVRPALKLDLSKVEFNSETNTFALPAPSAYAGYIPAATDDATALAAKVVKFNGHDWYLIEDNSTSETEGTITLFAADTSFGATQFNSSDYANKYSTSTVKTYLDGMTETGGAFADVADAIETVTVTTDNDTDVTAKLYLLSKSEAGALPANVLMLGNFTNAEYGGSVYWLRSPNPNDSMDAAYVSSSDGTIYNGIQVYRTFGVRPALQLDLSKVEFDSETNTFALPAHTHSFTYSADGATITATCSGAGTCSLTGNEATLTIAAPALSVYGGEGSAEATVTHNIEGIDTPTVVYRRGDIVLDAAPTDAGTYTASITLGDATASVTYTIGAKSVKIVANDQKKDVETADPKLTYTVEGLLAGDTLTGSLARAEGEAVGIYAITLGTLTAGNNYVLDFTGATLTICATHVETDVNIDENAPEMNVEGINEDVANAILTEEEKQAIDEGKEIKVYLEIIAVDEDTVPTDDKTEIEKEAETSGMKVGMYLDLSLLKKIGESEAIAVHDTNGNMVKVTLTVPEELRSTNPSIKRTFYVVRVHNGETTILGESTEDTISFETDKFSTYSLVYKDVSFIWLWILIIAVVIIAACTVVFFVIKKKKKTAK